ncbi:hypothetical protein MMCCUG48898_4990 [Mycobacteroides abscessus subsp. massiliense CCUG 48898 = JCM 15300]|nr:hypothetical protein MMCCUG48898_4990 [Mycobacteroides abscessus subsp. massiliense CCUG 48898 = JCM 15300]
MCTQKSVMAIVARPGDKTDSASGSRPVFTRGTVHRSCRSEWEVVRPCDFRSTTVDAFGASGKRIGFL